MKPISKLKQDAELTTNKEDEKKALSKAGTLLDDEKLGAVSGGECEVVRMVIGKQYCKCTGEPVEMVLIGTDSSGRISYYKCPMCGAQEKVFD